MIAPIFKHRFLILQLAKRDISSKYKGSLLGLLWTLVTPIAMLIVFSFVFGTVFQTKWPGNDEVSQAEFSLNLFIGLSVFWYFSESINRAPSVFTSVPNYVKKVVFPLHVLTLSSLLASLFQLAIHLGITLLASVLLLDKINVYLLYVPVIVALTFPLLMGLQLLLGSIGVYIRDINSITSVLLTLLMFLSPIFYPLSALPQAIQGYLILNPLTEIIESLRSVILLEQAPNLISLFIYAGFSLIVFIVGLKTYRLTRRGFADVI